MINEFGELSKNLSGLITENALAVERFEMFQELLIVVVVVVVVGKLTEDSAPGFKAAA